MSRAVQLHTQLAGMTTKQIEDTLDAGGFGSIGAPMARRELERRRAAHAKVSAALDASRTGPERAHLDREAQEKWDAEHALNERGVRAAETQATYAKRAFYLSIVAIGISVVALIVAAAQAAAQGMA